MPEFTVHARLTTPLTEVRVGGRTVEVCCEECATKLREAHASATTSRQASARS